MAASGDDAFGCGAFGHSHLPAMATPSRPAGIGVAVSRSLNRTVTGQNKTLSWSIAASRHPIARFIYAFAPCHFNESLEVYMRKIGPLKKQELELFQIRWGLTPDGKFGNQSMGGVLEVEKMLDHCEASPHGNGKVNFWYGMAVGVIIMGLVATVAVW